jgi:DNA-binding response OmpR family regulator
VREAAGPRSYFIFVTGHDDDESLLEGMRAGADAYLVKPIAFAELEEKLQDAARAMQTAHGGPSRREGPK